MCHQSSSLQEINSMTIRASQSLIPTIPEHLTHTPLKHAWRNINIALIFNGGKERKLELHGGRGRPWRERSRHGRPSGIWRLRDHDENVLVMVAKGLIAKNLLQIYEWSLNVSWNESRNVLWALLANIYLGWTQEMFTDQLFKRYQYSNNR